MIKKKVYGMGLALCMFFTMSSGGAALASPTQHTIEDRYILSEYNGEEAVFDTLEESYYVAPVDATGAKVEIEEYKDSLNISDQLSKGASPESLNIIVNESSNQQNFAAKATKRYVQDLKWQSTHLPIEISAWLECPTGAGPCSIEANSSITRTEEFSAGVTAGFKEIIASSVSFTWAKSASSSITMKLPVKPGVIAKMTFAPTRNYTRGQIWDGLHSSEMLYANCPAVLANGVHDGVYALKYK
ncbi:hypothetical protein NSQ20_25560 [Paenibacillus sp. FSL K6-1122]|uniref:DUF6060 domain-containing protein n=1 Tax=Paenibacillus sp. FSL K6-1122 TaxID=2954512 RepID=UPI0030ED46FD